MGFTMRQRHAIVRELAPRFQRASKKERSRMLDEFVQLTGYDRSYAAFVLRSCGKKQLKILHGGKRVVFVPGYARAEGAKRLRASTYGSAVFLNTLKRLWALSDGLCGKRLIAFIRDVVPRLERRGELTFTDHQLRQQLLRVSAATVDRLLAKTKHMTRLKGRSITRPGTLLKHHIAVRTFADWSDVRPGFCEVDLVAHDGGSSCGDYCHTLTLTDVATGWTELYAVPNKARRNVFVGLQDIRARLPFTLLGIDSDNGSEFINVHLQQYCEDHHITFTRSRPYRKNDNCYVEQKNYSIVRRTVSYYRYDTPRQLRVLQSLYCSLRLYTNFFQPVMKLREKVRHGSKLTRRYDVPQTPYRRLLEHPLIPDDVKNNLRHHSDSLNLLAMKREVNRLQQLLFRLAVSAGPPLRSSGSPFSPGPSHPWRESFPWIQHEIAQRLIHNEKNTTLSNTTNHE